MKIEKLPSGSYRIRKMYNGTTYTIVTDYKPTQKEAIQLLSSELDKIQTGKAHITFKTAAESYMSTKSNVLSPSTIRGYSSILKCLPGEFTGRLITDIDNILVQKVINDYSRTHSPKSVKNVNGFITAVMSLYSPNTRLSITLPQNVRKKEYIPTDEDVKRIIEYSSGSPYEIPLILATFGLRRSEVCALTLDDLCGNTLTINKAYVEGPDKKYIIKTTKTEAGTREIYLPNHVVELIQRQGYIYKGHPNGIVRYLHKTQDKLGIPRFSLHKFRHYYASMAHALNIPDAYIMSSGGWRSDGTLKTIYRHALEDKKEFMQKQAADYINNLLS